ncbi:hypothetical protein ACJMK2_029279 [Sinanodonta woodiana]|uniref:Uncharacterized protein n=1 Tax=Sinanodonta woodiana TaxID=1069815 RepID=A0ABD3XBZ3_SINWO
MVFSKLKQLKPSMMTDFKTATVKAFQNEFIGNTTQRINIQSNGLQHRYENNADFAVQMYHLPSLAFVPVQDVVLSYEKLLSRVDFPLESHPVLDYFEDTWIGWWSCFDNINDDLPKTNNSCEGWHRSFSEFIVLQKEQGLNEATIEKSLAGNPIQPQKKR